MGKSECLPMFLDTFWHVKQCLGKLVSRKPLHVEVAAVDLGDPRGGLDAVPAGLVERLAGVDVAPDFFVIQDVEGDVGDF